MDDLEIDPFALDRTDDIEPAETEPKGKSDSDLCELDKIISDAMAQCDPAVSILDKPTAPSPCSICGADIPGSYTLNAFFYSPGGVIGQRGPMTLPYSCFVCGKRLCPDCAEQHGTSLGAFLICSHECYLRICNIEGITRLFVLSVADDNMPENEGENVGPFWWSERCPVCKRVHCEEGECIG